jgi:DNA invertase Pin-like site-specific DNA recombinase
MKSKKIEAAAAAVVAYVRVSTDRQDVENQRLEILKLANEKALGQVRFVDETVSGRKSWRERAVAEVLDGMEAGDTIVVSELSRLGRSMLEIMEILSIATTKGVRVFAAKGNWVLDGTIQSKLVAMCFSMAAEIERDLISQRTRAALATRKAAGIKLGRPIGPGKSKLDSQREEVLELLRLGVTRRRVAKKFGTTEANLRHWLKRRGLSDTGKSSLKTVKEKI